MNQSIVHVALVVRDYDEALEFYIGKLNFVLVEDTYQPEQDKRWVVVSPPGASGTTLLIAKASKPEQESFVGNQTGGRVFLFLNTDDFWRDYNLMVAKGVKFVREPQSGRIRDSRRFRGSLRESVGLAATECGTSNCEKNSLMYRPDASPAAGVANVGSPDFYFSTLIAPF